jgi:hypothetical protein
MRSCNGEADDRSVDGERETLIEQRCRPDDHTRANHVEDTLERVGTDQEEREGNQCRHAPAAEHPIIDLQHVERPGKHQQIHDAGEQCHARERAPAIAQRVRDDRMDRSSGRKHPAVPRSRPNTPNLLEDTAIRAAIANIPVVIFFSFFNCLSAPAGRAGATRGARVENRTQGRPRQRPDRRPLLYNESERLHSRLQGRASPS